MVVLYWSCERVVISVNTMVFCWRSRMDLRTGLVGLTKETFNNASLRPIPWVNKKDGTKATLKSREASLWRSIKIQTVTPKNVLIGSDKPYAAIHHLGGVSRPMPERPYFPFFRNQLTKPGKQRMKDIIEDYMELGKSR